MAEKPRWLPLEANPEVSTYHNKLQSIQHCYIYWSHSKTPSIQESGNETRLLLTAQYIIP